MCVAACAAASSSRSCTVSSMRSLSCSSSAKRAAWMYVCGEGVGSAPLPSTAVGTPGAGPGCGSGCGVMAAVPGADLGCADPGCADPGRMLGGAGPGCGSGCGVTAAVPGAAAAALAGVLLGAVTMGPAVLGCAGACGCCRCCCLCCCKEGGDAWVLMQEPRVGKHVWSIP
eukprot:1157778-Pelagomonas_calceolata.AAC.9